jgi:hypothetical protein
MPIEVRLITGLIPVLYVTADLYEQRTSLKPRCHHAGYKNVS